jgi:hypothetical protein
MPRFSQNVLVGSAAFLCLGIGMLITACRVPTYGPIQNSVELALMVFGALGVGIGLTYPFGKTWIGILIAVCIFIYLATVGSL